MEEYRKIECYENYSVSNMGNVRNDKTGKILKGRPTKTGYLLINICNKNEKRKNILISRLVATIFIENPNNFEEVDHINRIPCDNRVENLRWISRGNNNRNKKKMEGTSSKYRGIYWVEKTKKWEAQITLNRKHKYIGRFETEEEAYTRWCEVVYEHNLQEIYGI